MIDRVLPMVSRVTLRSTLCVLLMPGMGIRLRQCDMLGSRCLNYCRERVSCTWSLLRKTILQVRSTH